MEEKILLAAAIITLITASASAVTIGDALASINGSYDIVWAYNASSGSWLRYVPGGGSNSLVTATVVDGYWIKMKNSGTLNVSGTEPSSTPITLASGWNLIGYPKLTAVPVATALSTIDGKYDIVWAYNASSGSWLRYVPGGGSNSLVNMMSGYGYWIKMKQNATLTVS